MLRAYFDESIRKDGTFCVGGIAFTRASASFAERDWVRLFGSYGGLHMTDLNARQRRFKGISSSESDRLVRGAVAIINEYASFYVAILCDVEEVNALLPREHAGLKHAYSLCCHMALSRMGGLIRNSADPSERVAYILESGYAYETDAKRILGLSVYPEIQNLYSHYSHDFVGKDASTLLQAGDFFSWECAKYFSSRLRPGERRPMRKSLVQTLIEGQSGVNTFDTNKFGFSLLTGESLREFCERVRAMGGILPD